jgi:hypothetical protein
MICYYTREACFRNQRFPVEIMHAGSIYENQIETFQRVWEQRRGNETVEKGPPLRI